MNTSSAKAERHCRLARPQIPIAHCSERDFVDLFRVDLASSTERVIILSPFLSPNRTIHYYPVFRSLTIRHVIINIYTKPKYEQPESLRDYYGEVERGL